MATTLLNRGRCKFTILVRNRKTLFAGTTMTTNKDVVELHGISFDRQAGSVLNLNKLISRSLSGHILEDTV